MPDLIAAARRTPQGTTLSGVTLANVTVTITGPGGTTLGTTQSDPVDGTWSITFPPETSLPATVDVHAAGKDVLNIPIPPAPIPSVSVPVRGIASAAGAQISLLDSSGSELGAAVASSGPGPHRWAASITPPAQSPSPIRVMVNSQTRGTILV